MSPSLSIQCPMGAVRTAGDAQVVHLRLLRLLCISFIDVVGKSHASQDVLGTIGSFQTFMWRICVHSCRSSPGCSCCSHLVPIQELLWVWCICAVSFVSMSQNRTLYFGHTLVYCYCCSALAPPLPRRIACLDACLDAPRRKTSTLYADGSWSQARHTLRCFTLLYAAFTHILYAGFTQALRRARILYARLETSTPGLCPVRSRCVHHSNQYT